MPTPRDDLPDPVKSRAELERRLRLAFVEGAEQHSREAMGRGLTDQELRRIIRRFPTSTADR